MDVKQLEHQLTTCNYDFYEFMKLYCEKEVYMTDINNINNGSS